MTAATVRRSLSGAVAESERGHGFRAVGVTAAKLTRPMITKRGGVVARLKAEWPTVVGPDCAEATRPAALARDGVLKLLTATAAALELQHRAPLLIERINAYFGHRVVSRLVFIQGLPRSREVRPDVAPNPFAAAADAANQRLGDITDPALRAALARLDRTMRQLAGETRAAGVESPTANR